MAVTFVVTGSSKGVGLEICRILIDKGYRVIGLSRTPGPLHGCDNFDWVACDLSVTEELYRAAERIGIISGRRIDGLVFNAAAGYYGDAIQMTQEVLNRLVTQNVTNQALLLQVLSPWFSDKAELFYVSTSASRIPAPMMAVYAATKAAFEFFIQSIAMERGFKIHIARPAEIDTSFNKTVGVPPEAESCRNRLSARKVAEEIISMQGSNRVFKDIGYRAKLIDLVVRIWPSALLKRTSSHLANKKAER